MLEIKENDTFVVPDNIFLQKIEELGKYWVFNIDTGEHYNLNETSYWIIERVAEKLPVQNILADFIDTFDVDGNEGTKDFNDIIINFLNEGIIKRSEI